MKINAIIPTYNEEDIIYHTIKYLVDQDIFVYILDNQSTDRTVDIARKMPNVQLKTFKSNGLFDEKILQDNVRELTCSLDTDWIIKNDADEFIESPWKGINLRQAIEVVDKLGKSCMGVTSYVFYPMSNEKPHESRKDVRDYYDYYKIWDKIDRWTPGIHEREKELWKINIFKKQQEVYMADPHILHAPYEISQYLFPELLILRHYPFRNPQRTYQRLIRDRKNRLSRYNLENNVSNHYLKYGPDSEFVQTSFTFDRIKSGCFRWSELQKKPFPFS